MTSRSTRLLVAATVTLGLAATAAIAAPLADTPSNRDKVVSGVTKMFSTRGITPDSIRQTALCQVTVDSKLAFDFTQLQGVVQLGMSSQFGGQHVADTAKGGNSSFVCVVGGGQCDKKSLDPRRPHHGFIKKRVVDRHFATYSDLVDRSGDAMSNFLHLHEIAARRGEGLRPELLAALKCGADEPKVVVIEQGLVVSVSGISGPIAQTSVHKTRVTAK